MTERIEILIRDYLSSNLSFISEDLQIIQAEYQLKNAFGTRGYIDILAQDKFQNFVIIEIKRSNQASRQAIHEVFKYASLLKQNLRIKDSEIKIIIISTEWDELLAPYSEFYRDTKFTIEGYRIYLNENNIPFKQEKIQPLKDFVHRNISPVHLVYLYSRNEDMQKAIGLLQKQMKKIGISDFVILEIFQENPEPKVIYPYGAYLAFQRYSEEYYLRLIDKFPELHEELKTLENYSYSDEELLHFLENLVLSLLRIDLVNDVEISYPEKFLTHHEVYNWKVNSIHRAGFFDEDPRLSDQMIVEEVKGLKGSSSTHYSNFTHSTLKARFQEIEQQALAYLTDNEIWYNHVEFALSEIKQNPSEFDLSIYIYSPASSILSTLYKMYNYDKFGVFHPFLFMPLYLLQVHFANEERTSLIYMGRIRWNGKNPSFEKMINDVFKGDASWFSMADMLGTANWIDPMARYFLGLEYTSDIMVLEGGQLKEIRGNIIIADKEVKYSNSKNLLYLEDFFKESGEFLESLNRLYDNYLVV